LSSLDRWLPVALWAGIMFAFSSGWFSGERTGQALLPLLSFLFPSADSATLEAIHQALRKGAHVGEYAVLSGLLYRALRTGEAWSARTAGAAILLAALYAAGDELHQVFVPERTAAVSDCLIDVGGAAAAQVVVAAAALSRRAAP